MELSIPTTEDIRTAIRAELTDFFASFRFPQIPETEDIGKGAEFASRITGKAVPTIYDLVHKRLIPHSKRGKDLYFSKSELLDWLKSGKRKTHSELALEAENFSSDKSQTK
ncbi:MAG: helix-turn-helix domain-containing protein [Acidobacteria bacterium]|jgi:predicted DNA-binding transcriptional regulator AlpA|nr:helix-turn-helix domain-containing protein [Acidobacteriota bacterium]